MAQAEKTSPVWVGFQLWAFLWHSQIVFLYQVLAKIVGWYQSPSKGNQQNYPINHKLWKITYIGTSYWGKDIDEQLYKFNHLDGCQVRYMNSGSSWSWWEQKASRKEENPPKNGNLENPQKMEWENSRRSVRKKKEEEKNSVVLGFEQPIWWWSWRTNLKSIFICFPKSIPTPH